MTQAHSTYDCGDCPREGSTSSIRKQVPVKMDVSVCVRPAASVTAPDLVPMPADQCDELTEADQTVLEWLAEDSRHRAQFILDHARALSSAEPDLSEQTLIRIERANQQLARAAYDEVRDVTFRSVEVNVDMEKQ